MSEVFEEDEVLCRPLSLNTTANAAFPQLPHQTWSPDPDVSFISITYRYGFWKGFIIKTFIITVHMQNIIMKNKAKRKQWQETSMERETLNKNTENDFINVGIKMFQYIKVYSNISWRGSYVYCYIYFVFKRVLIWPTVTENEILPLKVSVKEWHSNETFVLNLNRNI